MDNNNIRRCGILMHPTSFPSPYGIGDLGQEARSFIDCISNAGVKLWQILPLGPTGYGDSPYASRSCFAGNEYLIDLRSIRGIKTVFQAPEGSDRGSVDYVNVYNVKFALLKQAAAEFINLNPSDKEYEAFCKKNSFWLDDYAMYRALVDKTGDSRWFLWEAGLKNRKPETLAKYSKMLAKEIEVYKVLQFFFFSQWDSLHAYANSRGVKIVGDIPIFAAGESADVWTNRHLFKITAAGKQSASAGVPPDAFSPEGQLWGNPVYDWPVHKKDNYSWWKQRIEFTLKMVDIVRIDHFRGFESYWEVPAGKPNAMEGAWKKGPGIDFLGYFRDRDIIAEDLGIITDQVRELLAQTGWPGMKVLQFAFDVNGNTLKTDNFYLPHNFEKNCVAYTGTHDNQTSRGWFNSLPDNYKDVVRRYLQCPDQEVVWQMIRVLLASSANTVIIPVQDLIGLDDSARMNAPSTVGTFNWSWRMEKGAIQSWMT
ncbi:MAG: 4-alpha-glucanotransferase, partial [Spirochaetales bacterium]